jgi:hypothetical protein
MKFMEDTRFAIWTSFADRGDEKMMMIEGGGF